MAKKNSRSLCEKPPKSPNIIVVDEDTPVAKYREVINYDTQGEIISQTTTQIRRQNGSGFVLSYTAKMDEFIKKTSTGAVVRVFLYLAHHQGYGVDGVYGFRCSRQHIADALGINRRSVYSALEYLINEFLVNEMRVAGTLEYMVNPAYITLGSNRKARDREWSLRWEFYWKHKHDNLDLGGSTYDTFRENASDFSDEN